MVQLFYDRAFVTNDRGYAAAIVMVLLVLIVALTAVQFRLQRRWVHYACTERQRAVASARTRC